METCFTVFMSNAHATATDYRNAMVEAMERANRDAEFCRNEGKAAQVRAGKFPTAEATYTDQATDWYRRAAEHDMVAAAMRDAMAYAEAAA